MGYTKTDWKNLPNRTTPVTKDNLNKIEQGIYDATYETGVNISNEADEDYRVNLLETKNLFNYKDITQSANYNNQGDGSFVRTSDGRSITINCNSSSQPYGDFKLKKGTYSLSFDILLTGAMTMGNLNIQTYQNGTLVNIAKSLNIPIPANTLTHIVAEEVVLENDAEAVGFASFLSPSGTNVGITISNIQFEKGSSATTYSSFVPNQIVVDNDKFTDTLNVSPYIDSKSRVNVLKSKNLYNNKTDLTNTIVASDGSLTTAEGYVCSQLIPVKPSSTYAISYVNLSASEKIIRIGYYQQDGTPITRTTIGENATISTQANCYYIRVSYLLSTNKNVQVEEGSTITSYQSYDYVSIYVDEEEIYSKPVVLWQNGSPSSSFAGQDVSLTDNINNYSFYEVIFRRSTGSANTFSTGRIPTGFNTELTLFAQIFYVRNLSFSGSTATFGDGRGYTTYNSSSYNTNNNGLIPYMILGYK